MIEPVFVDSFAWIAAINKSDNYHEISLRILEELLNKQAKLITTNYVVVETIILGFCSGCSSTGHSS